MVCLDETSKQLITETRVPIPVKPGHPARHDYEYERNGTANLFMMFAPLEEVLQVRLQQPSCLAAGDHFIEGRQSVMGAQPCPSAERAWQEVLLVDGGENLGRAALERPVRNSRHGYFELHTSPIRLWDRPR